MPDRPTFFDRLLEKTILPFIPRSVTPNQVTIVRFILTPFVLLAIVAGEYRIALPLFFFTALTDAIDGAMARTRGQVTSWGKLYDPIADKVLVGSVVVALVGKHLGWLIAGLILFFELLFITLGYLWMKSGRKVQANTWGKIKMILQVIGITVLLIGLLFDLSALLPFSAAVLWLAIAFAIISLFSYGI